MDHRLPIIQDSIEDYTERDQDALLFNCEKEFGLLMDGIFPPSQQPEYSVFSGIDCVFQSERSESSPTFIYKVKVFLGPRLQRQAFDIS